MSPPPPQHPPALPELMDELVGEILLRIPPDEPAHLVRSALVCMSWFRIVSNPTFRRGYRERHRRPPLLGFVHNLNQNRSIPGFVSTTASPCSSPVLDCNNLWALDSRHGRVLIRTFGPSKLVVWNPVTSDQQHLPLPSYSHTYYTAAVLCAVAGCECDHLDCTGGPFLVVFVSTNSDGAGTWASVYYSETCAWSARVTADLSASTAADLNSNIEMKPSVLIGDMLYFTFELGEAILRYDLVGQSLTVLDVPEVDRHIGIVMAAVDGGLGLASIKGGNLHLWSWLTADGNTAGWKLYRVIQLQSLLPHHNCRFSIVGFAEGTNIIFVETEAGVFTIDIKSEKTRWVGERRSYYTVLPYMSFCAPVGAAGYLLPLENTRIHP